MTYDENGPERAMRELLAASNSMRNTLLQVKEEHPNLPRISIRVTASPEGNSSSSSPTSVAIVYELSDPSEAEVQLHADQLTAQGCSCTSVEAKYEGDVAQECDCTGAGV